MGAGGAADAGGSTSAKDASVAEAGSLDAGAKDGSAAEAGVDADAAGAKDGSLSAVDGAAPATADFALVDMKLRREIFIRFLNPFHPWLRT